MLSYWWSAVGLSLLLGLALLPIPETPSVAHLRQVRDRGDLAEWQAVLNLYSCAQVLRMAGNSLPHLQIAHRQCPPVWEAR